jgi:hypothetical protein
MSSEERGQWVYLVVSVVTYGAYLVLTIGQLRQRAPADIDYAPMMLAAIGVAIILSIVGRILVAIGGHVAAEMAGRGEPLEADVRDRDIGRFGEYAAGAVLGVAMVVPFILTLTESDHFWIANAMYLAFVLSAVVGTSVKLVAYRRGF